MKSHQVQVVVPVNWCSLCPFGKVEGPIWDRSVQEEVSDVICKKLGKRVYEDLSWSECASQCKNHVNSIDCPPAECPFNTK